VICWLASNTFLAYAVYFESSIISIVGVVFQIIVVLVIAYGCYFWARIVAVKQDSSFFRFNGLTTDEYASLSYVLPAFIATVGRVVFAVSFSDSSWQRRSETGLLVDFAFTYALHMTLISSSSRIFTYEYKFLISLLL